MLRFLIHRPVAVLMSFLGMAALGLIVMQTLPVGLLPDTPIPQITVQVAYPDVSARSLEDLVVRRLRNQLLQVGGLEDIHSRTRNGEASIILDFDHGVNTELAFIEVNEKIDQIAGLLPGGMPRPRVIKANISDIPVFYLSMAPRPAPRGLSTGALELTDFARTVVKRRIEQLPQVAFVDISGYSEPEILVRPDFLKMQALGLTEADLERIILENNLELGSILVQDGKYQYHVRFPSALQSAADIGGLYFDHQGRLLQLRDIGEVKLQPQTPRGEYRYNGSSGLVLTVRKQADARLFALKRGFEELLADLRAGYPRIEFAVTHDQTGLLQASVSGLVNSLKYGALFAFLVLFFFFREWRAPLLIGLAVPLALILAFLGFYLTGLTINVISLAGLILGIGLMIDNAIIVIENIRQQRNGGYDLSEACVRGGEEVIRPLISSALTTCSVFLPLIFLSGIAGALFYDQALSVSIALGASLATAYFLLPVLVRIFGPARHEQVPEEPGPAIRGYSDPGHLVPQTGYSWYLRWVDRAVQHRPVTLLLFSALVVAAGYFAFHIPKKRFPQLTHPATEVHIDWNEAIDLNENRRRIEALLGHFREAIQISNAFIGEQQFMLEEEEPALNESTLVLYLDLHYPEAFKEELSVYLSQRYPRAATEIKPLRNLFDEIFGKDRPPLIVHLQSTRNRAIPAIETATPLLNILEEKGYPTMPPPRQELLLLEIQREEALRYNVPFSAIPEKLRTLFNQNSLGIMRSSQQFIPIILGAEPRSFHRLIDEATVRTLSGDALPLRRFITVRRSEDFKELTANRAGESLALSFDPYDPRIEAIVGEYLRQETTLSAFFSGQYFENQRLLKELAVIMGISLMLLYLVLAAQFESLLQPLIVILTVPAGFAGALALLFFAGESLNLIAAIGLIVMSGIVVNDAILKVDMINRLRKDHGLIAAIHGAGVRRLRPILMTSITTILALLPVLFSSGLGAELQYPLALSVIGGLVAGTAASLFLVPALCLTLIRQPVQF